MPRKTYVWKNGEFVEINKEIKENVTPFVQDDTIAPLRNLANDKIYDSKSRYLKDLKKDGLEVVGNDLLSRKRHNFKEKITDEIIIDRIQKAESILHDPTKRRAYENMQRERYENMQRLLKRG